MIQPIVNWLQEVAAEIKKMVWPSQQELIGSVIIVCIFTFVAAIILGFMDSAFSLLIKRIIG